MTKVLFSVIAGTGFLLIGSLNSSNAEADRSSAQTVLPPAGTMTLWWTKPAPQWDQAVPVGNGRLGGMMFGALEKERIQLNEDTLWSGGPRDVDNPEALKHLPEVRRLLFAGQPAQAMDLANRFLMGNPKTLKPYQSLGDLLLDFPGHAAATDYRRELDLDTALARVTYRLGNAQFTREIFSSAVDQILVVRISCNQTGQVAFSATLNRSQDAVTRVAAPNQVIMEGQLDGGKGLQFQAILRAVPEGGQVTATPGGLSIKGANAVTLLLAAATSYLNVSPDLFCESQVAAAANKSYSDLRAAHVADYQRLFRRVTFELESSRVKNGPTDERLAAVQKGDDDPRLVTQYFQFGRYLLISCSRPGTMPANLQGLWADGMNPPWNSDYHLNINLEMNYWPAEVCNLSECALPLFDLIDRLREPGRKTAKVQYGCRGFVAHHITDAYGFTAPGDGAQWGLWPMGAAWLCQNLWEHYAFNNDRDFLARRAYPVMKESAEFFLDYLVEDAKGQLVTGPSISPENSYRLPNGQTGILCMGPSMDTQILRELFTHCIQASTELNVDSDCRKQLSATLKRLPPPQIGKYGQLMEWMEDYDEPEPGHRHMSHLFALHPGSQITPHGTPALAQAARKVLERRLAHGGGHTGWSRAWIINFWARLEDGDQAYDNVMALLSKSTSPNLFDLHPPFQIDGNFGATAGIAEMLLQSHAGEIHLLPALPKAWPDGHVKGLCARGGYEVEIAWYDGRLGGAQVSARDDGNCRVRTGLPVHVTSVDGKEIKSKQVSPGVIEFEVRAGQSYLLVPNA
ncbi:MAG: glycoside hydrolase family 95 protein [Candidatus Omnitrophica bacterium]|nr:glycoside hydrolase family 95 protein [Candidatus Omnitrophota bacterium]